MHVFCVGMYRAGSTWQYEVACHLIEQHRGGRRLGFVKGEQFAGGDGWAALKAHEGHEHFAAALAEGRARAVYCHRDLRDVAFSLAHVYRTRFEDIVLKQRYLQLCLANDEYWTNQPNVLVQRYDAMVADPVGAVAELANHLSIALSAREAGEVADRYCLEANRERAAHWEQEVRSRGIDPADPTHGLLPESHTLLHWNHIREGRVGGWRSQATLKQRAILALICGNWLKARGYENDDAWALDSLEKLGRMEDEWETMRRERADTSERLARAAIAAERLEDLERLGPVALNVAAGFHALSLRFPRLRNLLKKLLTVGRRRPEPGWAG